MQRMNMRTKFVVFRVDMTTFSILEVKVVDDLERHFLVFDTYIWDLYCTYNLEFILGHNSRSSMMNSLFWTQSGLDNFVR